MFIVVTMTTKGRCDFISRETPKSYFVKWPAGSTSCLLNIMDMINDKLMKFIFVHVGFQILSKRFLSEAEGQVFGGGEVKSKPIKFHLNQLPG